MALPYGCKEPSLDKIVDILRNPSSEHVNTVPPVKPKEGECFVFCSAPCDSKWYWRCDQYSWKNRGSYVIKDTTVAKTYFKANTTEFPEGDERFIKVEYALKEEGANMVFVCYMGDARIGETNPHGNSKANRRPFIRNAPIVKPTVVAETKSAAVPKAIYDELIRVQAPSGLEAVVKPRHTEQVRNIVKVEKRKHRLTHDALYNSYELMHQLPQFIRYYRVGPNLNVRILSSEMLASFDDAVSSASPGNPVQLLVDTTFNLGDFYVTTLLFRHPAFVGDPVMPMGFLFHEKKLPDDHRGFLQLFYDLSREFQTKPENVVIISDREFDFSAMFPNTKHVYCWIHLLDNVERWLSKNTVATKDQRDKYCGDVREMMKQPTKRDFKRKYRELKVHWDEYFLVYFKKHIKGAIKNRCGRWVVEPLGLYNPYSGITTNAVESFNAVIKRWQDWKEIPLDCSILALHRLVQFYDREIERGFYMLGDFTTKPGVASRGTPDQCPKREVIHADHIIAFIRAETDKPKIVGEDDDAQLEQVDSVEARAREVILKGRITLVRDQGCFVVTGDDDCLEDEIRAAVSSTPKHLKKIAENEERLDGHAAIVDHCESPVTDCRMKAAIDEVRTNTPMEMATPNMGMAQNMLMKQFSLFKKRENGTLGVLRPFVELLEMPDKRWVCVHFDGVETITVYSSFEIDYNEQEAYRSPIKFGNGRSIKRTGIRSKLLSFARFFPEHSTPALWRKKKLRSSRISL